jgi:hypothetical protein
MENFTKRLENIEGKIKDIRVKSSKVSLASVNKEKILENCKSSLFTIHLNDNLLSPQSCENNSNLSHQKAFSIF